MEPVGRIVLHITNKYEAQVKFELFPWHFLQFHRSKLQIHEPARVRTPVRKIQPNKMSWDISE